MIAGSMLGLGRALGETVAVLIILRAAQAGHWSLFDSGYTFASKIASAAAEFSSPLPTGAYIAAGFVLFALTFIVNGLVRLAAGGRVREDDATSWTRGQGTDVSPDQHQPQGKNSIARGLFWASFLIAMVPLVWVLYTG